MEWENGRKAEDIRLCWGRAVKFHSSILPLSESRGRGLHRPRADTLCSRRRGQRVPPRASGPQNSSPHSPPFPSCQQRNFLWPSAAALVKVHQLVHRISLPNLYGCLLFIICLVFSFLRKVLFSFYISFCSFEHGSQILLTAKTWILPSTCFSVDNYSLEMNSQGSPSTETEKNQGSWRRNLGQFISDSLLWLGHLTSFSCLSFLICKMWVKALICLASWVL